jgi:hypothetical protein
MISKWLEVADPLRLIPCLVNDYVSGFLGLSEGNAWSINAFDVSTSVSFSLHLAQLILLL